MVALINRSAYTLHVYNLSCMMLPRFFALFHRLSMPAAHWNEYRRNPDVATQDLNNQCFICFSELLQFGNLPCTLTHLAAYWHKWRHG